MKRVLSLQEDEYIEKYRDSRKSTVRFRKGNTILKMQKSECQQWIYFQIQSNLEENCLLFSKGYKKIFYKTEKHVEKDNRTR